MLKHTFNSGDEMYEYVYLRCLDLYNLETGANVWICTDNQELGVHYLSLDEAREIARQADDNECWSGYECGADVYDAQEYCDAHYNDGVWVQADQTILDDEIKEV